MKVSESKIVKKDIILQQQPNQPEPCCPETHPEQLSSSDQQLLEVVQSIFPTPAVPASLTNAILERIRSKTAPSS